MLQAGAARALNHLLAQDDAARARLAPFAGRTVEFRRAPFPPLALRITEGGLVERADAVAVAPAGTAGHELVVTLQPGALPLLAMRDPRALADVRIAGNAELAAAVQSLFREMRWDAEEDLSRVVGDAAAHQIARSARAFAGANRDAALRLGQNLAEYWTEENPLLARPADVATFCSDVDRLRDDVARLEKRLGLLARAAAHGEG